MRSLLKGNYELPDKKGSSENEESKADVRQEQAREQFERRALEQLGGSIAFVMKAKTFVWNGDQQGESKS